MRHSVMGVALLGFGLILASPLARAAEGDLKVGDKAPAFKLEGTDGKMYSLDQFKGKSAVVLAWFPKADTPGCTLECKSLREHGDALKPLKVAYFTASVDPVAANKKFAEKLGLDYPILSDPDSNVAKAYGVVHGERKFAERWTFYIDKEGIIKGIDKKVDFKTAGLDVAGKIKELGLNGQ